MKDQKNITFTLSKCFLSFFYVGFIKKAPGTFGSIATLPLIYFLSYLRINLTGLIILIALLTIIASFSAEYVQKLTKTHDPQWIVMDELIGMLVTWAFIFPVTDYYLLLPLLGLFRLFDIIKIWPASYFDKKIKHGYGTIVDDIISGMMAGFILWLVKNYYLNL
ncbi:MAG: phosphatidylglycerophosphatase A [Bacteriovoracaceae bacterium]|nr:phosphatidylglycerophosphatase A [Bacteriovoracaceae bacterium]